MGTDIEMAGLPLRRELRFFASSADFVTQQAFCFFDASLQVAHCVHGANVHTKINQGLRDL
jgi:hypothetical protein